MDLIDPYIRSVRLFLPREQRDDIIRELEDDLRSQVEDKQGELGRHLTRDEQAALLRPYGHPMLMAGRYRRARNLIGPVIFPIYWQVLKLVIGLVVATNLASIGVLIGRGGPWSEVAGAFASLLDNGLEAAVFITLVAACLEWSLARFRVLEKWDPASMPSTAGPHRMAERAAERAARDATRTIGSVSGLVDRALKQSGPPIQVRSVSEFVMLAVFSCWAVLGLLFPGLIFAGGSSMVAWSPAVDRFFPFIAIAVGFTLVDQFVRLMRPGSSFVRFTRLVWVNAGWILVLLLLNADHRWVVWIGTPEQQARYGWSLVTLVNGIITVTLVVATVATLIGPCSRLWRMIGRRGPYVAQA